MIEQQPWLPEGAEHPPGQIPKELKVRTWFRSPAMWVLVLTTVISVLGFAVLWAYAARHEPNGPRDPLSVHTQRADTGASLRKISRNAVALGLQDWWRVPTRSYP